jgi:hypothetical protein
MTDEERLRFKEITDFSFLTIILTFLSNMAAFFVTAKAAISGAPAFYMAMGIFGFGATCSVLSSGLAYLGKSFYVMGRIESAHVVRASSILTGTASISAFMTGVIQLLVM